MNKLLDNQEKAGTSMGTDEIKKAFLFAKKAHAGQVDKAGKDYILHPLAVAAKLKYPDEKVLALLHDVVEDTNVTLEDIKKEFGEYISYSVDCLTHRSDETYDQYIRRISKHPIAARVKLADLNHNMDLVRLSNITEADRSRFEKYSRAYQMLLDAVFFRCPPQISLNFDISIATEKTPRENPKQPESCYYIIKDPFPTLARLDSDERAFAYIDQQWVERPGSYINDYVHGFDPSEPVGSPYRYGNGDILHRIHEIPEFIAQKLIEVDMNEPYEMTVLFDDFAEQAKHTEPPDWREKLAEISYRFEGQWYRVKPKRLHTTDDIFCVLANELMKCMEELGATDVSYLGTID